MNPTEKSDEMEQFINKVIGASRKVTIQNDMCIPKPIGCGQPVGKFRDELSKREYRISGLCQQCQDKVFGE